MKFCGECLHKRHQAGGHCYMFKDEPKGPYCGQFEIDPESKYADRDSQRYVSNPLPKERP